MNTVEIKLQQLADPIFNKVTFSKSASIFERVWYLAD